jgi:hypothetical protein
VQFVTFFRTDTLQADGTRRVPATLMQFGLCEAPSGTFRQTEPVPFCSIPECIICEEALVDDRAGVVWVEILS